jgi:hypothetical protein
LIDVEKGGVKHIYIVKHITSLDVIRILDARGVDTRVAEFIVGELSYRYVSTYQVSPELIDVPGAGEPATHADYRNVSIMI